MVIEPIVPELLTIQQVADRVGLTRQALYPRLDRDLSDYYVEVDGRKMLKATVIEYILSKPVSKVDSKVDDKIDTRLLDALQAHVDLLTAQLAIKDAQLAAADERLHESNSISMSSLNLSDRQQQLYLAAIADAEEMERAESTHTDTPEPPQPAPEQPVKQKWYQRLFVRRKPTK